LKSSRRGKCKIPLSVAAAENYASYNNNPKTGVVSIEKVAKTVVHEYPPFAALRQI